jgi:CHAD domain-containing protein
MEIYYNIYEKSINKWLTSFKEVQTQLGEWNDYRILLTEIEGYTDKKEFFKNNINIVKIQNYISELLVQRLEQSKVIMSEYLTLDYINKTKADIKRICKLHKCI